MDLNTLPQVVLENQMRTAYQEPRFIVEGLTDPVSLYELLVYLLGNSGGGPGGTDSFVVSAALLAGNSLQLTRNTGQLINVDLSVLAGDEHVDDVELVGTNLVVTFDDGTTDIVDLSPLQDGGEVNTGNNVGGGVELFRNKTGATLNFRTLQAGTGIDITPDPSGDLLSISATGGGGSSLVKYEANNDGDPVNDGAFVTATDLGATYERTGGAGANTEGIITLPLASSFLTGCTIHFTAAQAPGVTFYLNIDYPTPAAGAGNRNYDSLMMPMATVATKPAAPTDAAPATNYVHTGTPIQVGVAGVSENAGTTRIRIKISNYAQQVGANASMLSVLFP